MRTAREIQMRLQGENDAFAIEVLRWVLEGGCPMFDALEAQNMESDRKQTIVTLDAAEDIVIRIQNYLNELETQKEAAGGISSEFVTDAAKLIGQANSSLKLVGQLKKEIGVDSQLLLAQAQVNDMSRILVDVLGTHPQLLDQVELKMALLKEPSVIIHE